MRRVLLIGPGGAGKSTLAATIASRLGLPLIHLDAMYWKPGWQETPKDEWRDKVAALVAQEAWVMDGNFGGTLDLRLAACDTVLFLDMPPLLCMWRVLRRRWRFHREVRPDMAAGCIERLDADFLLWILAYRWRSAPRVRAKLDAEARAGKQVFVLDSQAAVDRFLDALPEPGGSVKQSLDLRLRTGRG
ncbi:AAA family ATPase [Lysobacter niastensis]|uniref:ATPase AAA-type core domain-containing protein n=1 Tax=Lysobacter niastensis TaxID=380629 RepID=A0ABS0B343_9GAMM|nr:AAA family ATPase [Lysobacter niastensis]MBF6022895.1 hypothetical protein [Lysobacter niastensis]